MSPAVLATEPFAVADELTCYYDRPSEPANVHLEVRLPGRLDQNAFRSAVGAVLSDEQGLLARRASASPWRRRYHWEFAQEPDADPLTVGRYADEADLDRQRDEFLSVPPPLDIAPPFLLRLASGPDGDCLLLNVHHARLDGLACLRLLTELAAAYRRVTGTGEAEAVAPERACSRPVSGASNSEPAPARRSPGGRRSGQVTRIAPGQGLGGRPPRPGYGACLLAWEGPELPVAARSAGASVNDLLITAFAVTIADWNASRRPSADPGLIRITMPVGDRGQVGPGGSWANRSRLAAVAVRARAGTEPADLLTEVASQTALAKRRSGPPVGTLFRTLTAAPVPAVIKSALLRSALRVAGPRLCDTALLSNLGSVDPPAFGELTATELWFSTSAHLPRGLSLGAVTSGGRLRLTFRYRIALLSAADADEFARRYVKALDQLVTGKAAAF